MALILDSYGRPVLHPGDVIALRQNGSVREPLCITRVVHPRIYYKYPMDMCEHWEFEHDVEVKLLARADEPPTVTP